MADGTAGDRPSSAHEHGDDCRALFREWMRYGLVVADASGCFSADDVASAARERAMFERQLRALGCSAAALLEEWRVAEAERED